MPTGATSTARFRGHQLGRNHGAASDAYRNHALEEGGLRQRVAERNLRPLEHDELQRGAGTPEQGGCGQ